MISRSIVSGLLGLAVSLVACDRQDEPSAGSAVQHTRPADSAQVSTPDGKIRALLDQFSTEMQAQRWTEAQRLLQQLEALKATAPAELQTEIENARSALVAAKAISEEGKVNQR